MKTHSSIKLPICIYTQYPKPVIDSALEMHDQAYERAYCAHVQHCTCASPTFHGSGFREMSHPNWNTYVTGVHVHSWKYLRLQLRTEVGNLKLSVLLQGSGLSQKALGKVFAKSSQNVYVRVQCCAKPCLPPACYSIAASCSLLRRL